MQFHTSQLAMPMLMVVVTASGCDIAHRPPIALIEPTYSYLRQPVEEQVASPQSAVASLPSAPLKEEYLAELVGE